MEKKLKRKIRKWWRDRLLLSIVGFILLGSSVIGLQSYLRHRSKDDQSWLIELSQAAEVLLEKEGSQTNKDIAISKIREIAISHDLDSVLPLLQALADGQIHIEDQVNDVVLIRDPLEALNQLQNWTQIQVSTPISDLYPTDDFVEVLNENQDFNEAKDKVKNEADNLPNTIEQSKVVFDYKEAGRAWARVKDLRESSSGLMPGAQVEAYAEARLADKKKASAESRINSIIHSYVSALAESQRLIDNIAVVTILSTKLEQDYELFLPEGESLETLVLSESRREQAITWSWIGFGISSISFLIALILYFQLQRLPRIPRSLYLIQFLPEEYIAELRYLQRRLSEKEKMSLWDIRKRLIHELAFLLWTYYTQTLIDNLFLGSNQDDTIDD